jgi:predicted ATPase
VAGSLDGTIDMATRGLEHARALNHRPSIAHGLMWSAELHELRREPEEVESLIDIVLPMLDKNASAVGLANSMMLRGWARVAAGRTADGIGELREGLAAWRSTGSGFHVPHRLGRSADGFRLAGIPDEALRLVDEGLAAATRSGDLWYTAELHRLKGELLRMTGGDPQDVAGEFEAALRVATRQGARLFELRATTALARLEAGHGGASTALTRLSALTQSFADGAALRDVAEAREILAHR